jgi:RNA polymerase sigma-70 factor (ECF subfamily)
VDDDTIRAFLRDDYPRVVAAVSLVSGSQATAEDAVQEALLRAWSRSERGEPIDSLPAWVVTVALNLSRSGIRRVMAERRARQRVMVRVGPVAEPSSDPTDVRRALAALPRRQREVAVLRYLIDLDTRETSSALGISEGTVKSTLAKARSALGEALSDDLREDANDRGQS